MKQLKEITICLFFLFTSQFMWSQYAEYDWKDRDTWMNVDEIFDIAGIKKGSYVADIGCHEGYLTVHLAKRVDIAGKVFGVDVRKDRLDKLKDNLKERAITNVSIVHGDYDNPKLPKNTLDVVIIMDTYHEMEDNMEILKHVYNSLKPNGKIVIVEKLKKHIKGKPRTSQVLAHSLSPNYVKKELTETGFTIIHQNNDMGDWENNPDKVIWMLIATK